ncbi:cytochrome P450 oxidoreductase OrdA-like protein [Aspergillus uvarum CBS 121591]|uniref:Cytochrome P450 oxidoreductase OrdA-like protein n=1 Tax=Aspergillus uvarum CBS 121591 TaxID=1448315 RepID=A0A319BY47_9EURO|nr:cytochrome P450 oxidoreductase OrdA-like protein [Aspergillus uvarum CBS 121591]PYH76350.1 cytochrome P450 oxidoreductase OrdA-like protein [Aspergillus uvarum CBS 121591]
MLSALLAALLLLAGYLTITLTSRKKHPPLPPGPPRQPIIGNLNDLPRPGQQDWKHWLKHKELYGPISSLSVLGQTIIILNEARHAVDLLEKRSAIYSSRPQQNFAEMSGWHNVLGSVKSTDRFRATRKNLHQEIGSNKSVARFDAVQTAEVGRFLMRVLEAPGRLMEHIRKETGAIILKVGYGYTVEPHGRDPLVELADRAMEDFSVAMLPATYLVDYLPFLRHLPAWFPGASFIRTARGYKKTVTAFSDLPYAFVQHQMHRDTEYTPSFLSNLLQHQPALPLPRGSEAEVTVKWSAASLYAGGADTVSKLGVKTVSSIATFFLAMALFPAVQRKAQAELDMVLGAAGRLPTFADRENLPYINALIKEVFRWHPVVPMDISHVVTQEDEYEGYWIPKGASVLANIWFVLLFLGWGVLRAGREEKGVVGWAFTHDPDVYPDPEAFRPERFLPSSSLINGDSGGGGGGAAAATTTAADVQRDPHLLVFGFGRRVCPGRTLADTNVYLTIAQALTVFRIQGPENADWTPEFRPGVISHPVVPAGLRVEARSEAHAALVREVERVFPFERSHSGELVGLSY